MFCESFTSQVLDSALLEKRKKVGGINMLSMNSEDIKIFNQLKIDRGWSTKSTFSYSHG